MKFHLFQFASTNGQPLKTLRRVQSEIKTARIGKGDWVVFPEMWPSGFLLEDRLRQQVENAFCFQWLKDFSRAKKCYMAGSMLEIKKGRYYNSAYLIDPQGHLLARYRKIHLFRYGREQHRFEAGKKTSLIGFSWGKLGIAICYDLRFPELFRKYSKAGAKLILLPSAWPKERLPHFLALLKARAIENLCFVVGANKIGRHDSGIPYGGHSAVFGPWGEKLGELGAAKGVLSVDLRIDQVDKIRKQYPFLEGRVL